MLNFHASTETTNPKISFQLHRGFFESDHNNFSASIDPFHIFQLIFEEVLCPRAENVQKYFKCASLVMAWRWG